MLNDYAEIMIKGLDVENTFRSTSQIINKNLFKLLVKHVLKD